MGGDSRKPKKTGDGPPCRTLQIYLAMQVCVRGRPAPPGRSRAPALQHERPPRRQTRGRRAVRPEGAGLRPHSLSVSTTSLRPASCFFLPSPSGSLFLPNTRAWRLKSARRLFSRDPPLACSEALGLTHHLGQALHGHKPLRVERRMGQADAVTNGQASGNTCSLRR